MTHDRRWLDRRSALGTLGVGVVFALAGCLGDDDDEESDDTDENTTDDEPTDNEDGSTDNDDTTDTEELEATAFPDGEECAVCNMITEDHPDWNAQLVHENGERAYFCSSGCLLAYHVDSEAFDGPDSPTAGAWVTDYETGELVDGTDAYYVRVADPDHVDDIMMMNPTPFDARTSAEDLLENLNDEHGTVYDDNDIITFENFDHDLAVTYRSNFFDEESE